MILNIKQIKEKNIITPSEYTKYNQTGVDLSLNEIHLIKGGIKVYQDRTETTDLEYIKISVTSEGLYHLQPGAYALEFNEGCNIPAEVTGKIITRSSLYRGGALITSPLWDPGFKTDIMGTTMIVHAPIFIEPNARVAQMYFWEGEEPDSLYDGQWQNMTNK